MIGAFCAFGFFYHTFCLSGRRGTSEHSDTRGLKGSKYGKHASNVHTKKAGRELSVALQQEQAGVTSEFSAGFPKGRFLSIFGELR